MFVPVFPPPCIKAKQKPVRKQFTYEEDKALREAVTKYGENWEQVSAEMKGRTVRQCRDRWNKYLAPTIKDRIWTDEEDDQLLALIQQHGTKWARLSQFFPGRSDNSIKNRYKQLMTNEDERRRREGQIRISTATNPPEEKYGKLTRRFLETREISEEIIEQAERCNQRAIDSLRELFRSLGPVKQRQTSNITTKM